MLELLLVPSAVQGELAPVSIIEALADLHTYAETEHIDAVIVGRGGGSAEDLMPYNDEMVARTIFASQHPRNQRHRTRNRLHHRRRRSRHARTHPFRRR